MEDDRLGQAPAFYGAALRLCTVVADPTEGEARYLVDISGYGSENSKLLTDNVYFIGGRLLKTSAGTYRCFYEPALTISIGSANTYVDARKRSKLIGKVNVFGFGTITRVETVSGVGLNGSAQENLEVTMMHHDWDNVKRTTEDFPCLYTIPGNSVLKNAHSFFIVGLEAIIIGNITGLNEQTGIWNVTACLFSITSPPGHDNRPPATPSIPGTPGPLRPNLRQIGGGATPPPASRALPRELSTPRPAGIQPMATSSNVQPIPGGSSSHRPADPADSCEAGEIFEDNTQAPKDEDDEHFVSTDKNGKRVAKSLPKPTPTLVANSGSTSKSLLEAAKKMRTMS
ncbi:hypothetical protein PtA15_7A804 [Puccinia triticina]|uniref:Uncharacterized protein n=1 Tax=Puccinia triticina TaxID=208348 RepID=A0ABY7CP83_9BASI|nr:uncharacterized protein PtA15_7A804 [Puccinia triticina]WAQ87074.1 hypothetical protein PtA15_7A804 [Puccinia triticina]